MRRVQNKILDNIIREHVEMLMEKQVMKSIDATKLASLLSKCNFLPTQELGEENSGTLTLYYNEEGDLNTDFNRLSNLVNRAGWVVSSCGNYYDGLRNMYLIYSHTHPEFNKSTVFVNLETEYGQKMDDYFGPDGKGLSEDDEEYDEEKHLGVTYQRGVFYHVTRRRYLKSILAHGLRPKNGGGITNWRDTSDRLYLSLLPDFSDVELFDYDEEEGPNDSIILKVDLRPVMRNFDFYVDQHYDNAVYTYSNIPPKFIEVITVDKVNELWSKFMVQDRIKQTLRLIIDHNFKGYDTYDTARAVYNNWGQISQIIQKNVEKMLEVQKNINYNGDIEADIDEYIDKYCNV